MPIRLSRFVHATASSLLLSGALWPATSHAMDQAACPALHFDSDGNTPWSAHPKAQGVFIQYLVGRPSDAGLFKYRLQLPAGFALGMHTHSGALAMTILCGSVELTTTVGSPHAAGRGWESGSAHYFPASSPHAEGSASGAIIEVVGIGPISTEMLDATE